MKTNLFYLDSESIRSTLFEANINLLQRARAASIAATSLSDSDTLASRAQAIKSMRELGKELKRSRTADGASFREASAVVKEFFDDVIKPLERQIKRLTPKLSELSKGGSSDNRIVIASTDGEVVVQSGSEQQAGAFDETWEIAQFDRKSLDFNLLADHFSDYHIKLALNNHLKRFGPNQLTGVEYLKVVKVR